MDAGPVNGPQSAAGTHRIRANHREWSPPQVIYAAPETMAMPHDGGEKHVMTAWAARLEVRRSRYKGDTGTVEAVERHPVSLAEQADYWCKGQRTMWFYAHNLSYFLSVSRLPVHLAAIGWKVTGHAMTSDSPWLRMRKGNCVLTMADAGGWLRASIRDIAADLAAAAPQPPPAGRAQSRPGDRALAEARTIAAAMGQVMTWWDSAGLGSWTLTGSAAGWNCYRHKSAGPLPLIRPGDGGAETDRAAIYGGRREAFRWGALRGGPWQLMDFKAAYPSIAARFPLPVARQGNFASLDIDSPLICGAQYGIIAECEICTDEPRWPVRVAGRVAYPVGRFKTVLAGPEIAEAKRLGCLVSIGPGWLHELSDHMGAWARWVLAAQDGNDPAVPVVARRAIKHWGRAVIGKFAAHGYETRPLAGLGSDGWYSAAAWNAQRGAPSHLTEVCDMASETIACGDGDNAYPAVLAFVESWTRVHLAWAMEDFGISRVVCCDTDGFIFDAAGLPDMAAGGKLYGTLLLRPKKVYSEINVIGPQHVITDSDRKLAGIPKTAVTGPDGRLEARLWPKLGWQMQHAAGALQGGYIRPLQVYNMPETTVTGWRSPWGSVLPLQSSVCEHGKTSLDYPAAHYVPDGARVGQSLHLKEMITHATGSECTCPRQSSRSHGTVRESGHCRKLSRFTSRRKMVHRKAGKRAAWLNGGKKTAIALFRASYGWTRILWPTLVTCWQWIRLYEITPNGCTSSRTNSGPRQQAAPSGYGATAAGPATDPKCRSVTMKPPNGFPWASRTPPVTCLTLPPRKWSHGTTECATWAYRVSPGSSTSMPGPFTGQR